MTTESAAAQERADLTEEAPEAAMSRAEYRRRQQRSGASDRRFGTEDPDSVPRSQTPPVGTHRVMVSRGRDRSAADSGSADDGDDEQVPGRLLRPAQKSPWRRFLREVVVVGGIALVISFLIKTFLVQAFWIPSGSMEQTLVYGDRVLVSKIQAGPMTIERGDVVVFTDPGGWMPTAESPDRGAIMNAAVSALEFVGLSPTGEGNHLIKRVIGVGGDHVVCCDENDRITVNGAPLEESYVYPGDAASTMEFDITVPEDHFWVMGDHRSNSLDSRYNDDGTGATGSVPADNVVGQAMVLVWPLDRAHIFSRPAEVFSQVPEPGTQ